MPHQKPDIKEFRPSEFMRARRPELFSDSRIVKESRLNRESFEYHLETITKRKQEIQFEHFCRRLAEKEICPNLLPQTGPTGGGDSKVDTETYPVSDEISVRWYEGVGREASRERWAFAFSAKEDWRSKVQSDVEKIVNTQRDYRLVYFMTNQFVRDKIRAEVEDSLKEKYQIEVRIVDRTWIVERIFKNNRTQLAVEALSLTGYDEIERKVTGPHDTEREAELRQLEEQIEDCARYQGVQYQLAEDCLEVALLARGLELPRIEVEGRFLRAERIAEKIGNRQQRLRIAYAKAWTSYWWFDDPEELNRLYVQVEELALESAQATDLEKLANLWQLLNTGVKLGQIDREAANHDVRTASLQAALERLTSDTGRPSNALLARTNRLLMDVHDALQDDGLLTSLLSELKAILVASEGLVEFPLDPLTEIIREAGNVLVDSTEYDELFEYAVQLTERRTSEGTAGRMLLRRGYQKLRAGRRYDAISLLGRAQQKLAMHECRSELISALASCGLAYEAAGLLWAARANMLAAANLALSELWRYGDLVTQALPCLRKLVWLEIQLGRVPCILAWMEVLFALADRLMLDDERKDAFRKEVQTQDMVLGILLLRTELWELKWLDFLPSLLEKLGLLHSQMAVLYALGYEDHLRKEGIIPDEEDSHGVREFFWMWVNQPAGNDIPERPELLRESSVEFRSFVLGCEIVAGAANNLTSILLAETILAALESLLATSLNNEVFPYRSDLKLDVKPSEYVTGIPEFRVEETDGEPLIIVRHSPVSQHGGVQDRKKFRSWLIKLIATIVSRIAVVRDPESYFEQLARDDAGFGRAVTFLDIPICVGNLLGEKPKLTLSDWNGEAKGVLSLKRSVPWHDGLSQQDGRDAAQIIPLQPGVGEPPEELFGTDHLKHRDRRILTLINPVLWDRAGWLATVYLLPPRLDVPPLVALAFKDAEAARAIFSGWRRQIGEQDSDDRLRITFITGIDKAQPASYKVLVGINPRLDQNDLPGAQFIMISRIHRMDPENSRNIEGFLQRFQLDQRYFLLPAQYIGGEAMPQLFTDLAIMKRKLRVIQAWQLDENDPDICALSDDDVPIIPEGIEDAPVQRALQRIERLKHQRC